MWTLQEAKKDHGRGNGMGNIVLEIRRKLIEDERRQEKEEEVEGVMVTSIKIERERIGHRLRA